MSNKAKFKCTGIVDIGYMRSIQMNAVVDEGEDTTDYNNVPIYGNITLNVDKNAKSALAFEKDSTYYLHFERTEL